MAAGWGHRPRLRPERLGAWQVREVTERISKAGAGPEAESNLAGAIVSKHVLDGREPLRVVVHHDDGMWTFTCGTTDDAEDLVLLHAHHMFRQFGYDLFFLRDLQQGFIAERDTPLDDWTISPFEEEE